MTTEEWRTLPTWVKVGIIESGYSARQVARVRHDIEATPPKIDVVLVPPLPQEIAVTVVVDAG